MYYKMQAVSSWRQYLENFQYKSEKCEDVTNYDVK